MGLCSEMGALHRGREGGEDLVGGSMGRNLEIYVEHNEFMAIRYLGRVHSWIYEFGAQRTLSRRQHLGVVKLEMVFSPAQQDPLWAGSWLNCRQSHDSGHHAIIVTAL